MVSLIPVALLGLLVGVLVGCVGIGGILLVPSLVYLGGAEVQVAIASCMMSYLFSGAVGVWVFARRGSVRWSGAGWLCLGAAPGAFVGAAAVSLVPPSMLELIIAALLMASGVYALVTRGTDSGASRWPTRRMLILVGLVVGVGSALTGTGGPLILMPVLLWLRVPILSAVGLSQVIQVPIASLATVANLGLGTLDLRLALTLGVALMGGVALGARLAHGAPVKVLKAAVALVLVLAGSAILLRLIRGMIFTA